MASILVFAGGPRENGSSNQLLAEVVRGAESAGGVVKRYDLNHPGLRGCQGCFHCRSHPDCSVEDCLSPVYGEMGEATGVVVASPIYFGQITGQTKLWLDRMFPMIEGSAFSPRHPGKKALTIFSQGDGNEALFRNVIESMHGFIRMFGWELQDSLLCAGTGSPGFAVPDELLHRARAAGEALVG